MCRNIRTLFNFEPPATEAQIAILADLAEVTRWKTSCCGIEPSIIVTQAPMKVSQAERPSVGKNSSLPA